jgi:hypothetical protein
MTAQWASIVATPSGLLTANSTLAVTGNVTVPSNSNSYFANTTGTNFWRPTDTGGNSYFRISSGGFYVDAANYYFRNASSAIIMSLANSGATTINGSLTVNGQLIVSDWFRSTGNTGWYSNTYGGGIYMTDGTWVRVYNGKRFFSEGGYSGNIQYGSYGSLTVYGTSGGWAGIAFADGQGTLMIGTGAGREFGHFVNNATWNFYISNGTFVPSDARYKRDIEPLEHGMNLLREIVPVTYDPLTENTDDDPEATVGRTHYGFTTQNILQALTNAGETRDVAIVDVGGCDPSIGGDRQYLNHSGLIAPMVKAIQELDQRLQLLETV